MHRTIAAAAADRPAFGNEGRVGIALALTFPRQHGRTKGLKKGAVYQVAPGIVLGMPLHPQRKARGIGDANGLDGAVLRHPLHDDALAGLEDALAVQRVYPDALTPQIWAKTPPETRLTSWRSAKTTAGSG